MRGRHKIPGHTAIAAIASLVWMSIGIPSIAQTLDRGEVNGTIRDESGAVLPGVAVMLRETVMTAAVFRSDRDSTFMESLQRARDAAQPTYEYHPAQLHRQY